MSAQGEDLTARLIATYREWFASIVGEGIGPLDEVLAEEWMYTNYDGLVRTKSEYLDWVAAVVESVEFAGPYDVEVRRYGDLALVLGGYRVDREPGGGALELRFTGLWIERDGRWQCLTHHNSEVT